MRLEALNQDTKGVFQKLGGFKEYYLAGGTALALQLGHRISIDFDFFSKQDIPGHKILKKIRSLFGAENVRVVLNHPEQLSLRVNDVSISFAKYRFPVLLKFIEFQNVKMVNIREIAAMKAFAIGQRATLKDYVDLYFIVSKKYIGLSEIIEISQKKFKDEFEPKLFLEQLIYIKDIRKMEIIFLKNPVTKEKIQKFFEKEIKKIKL